MFKSVKNIFIGHHFIKTLQSITQMQELTTAQITNLLSNYRESTVHPLSLHVLRQITEIRKAEVLLNNKYIIR